MMMMAAFPDCVRKDKFPEAFGPKDVDVLLPELCSAAKRRSGPIVTERVYLDSALHQVESPQKPTSDRLRHDVHSNGRRLCPRSEASRRRSAFVHKSAGLGCRAGVPWPLHIPLAAPTCALLVRCRRMLRRAMLGVGSSY